MAHPKHKVSSTRRDKRRTHYKAVVPTVVTAQTAVQQYSTTAYAPSAASIAVSSQSRRRQLSSLRDKEKGTPRYAVVPFLFMLRRGATLRGAIPRRF